MKTWLKRIRPLKRPKTNFTWKLVKPKQRPIISPDIVVKNPRFPKTAVELPPHLLSLKALPKKDAGRKRKRKQKGKAKINPLKW